MRQKLPFIICTLLLFRITCSAQVKVCGHVVDQDNKAIQNAILKVYNDKGKLISYSKTNTRGEFSIENTNHNSPKEVTVEHLGYKKVRKDFGYIKSKGIIKMEESAFELKEIVVKNAPISQTNDTLVYNVSSFKRTGDNSIEDVLKHMPGISVDDNGSISYKGERINRFYIEGMDLLSGNYTIASQNIKADDVATVSVYENHQPQKVLKDFVFSDKAAINLKIKDDRKFKPIGHSSYQQGEGDKWTEKGDLFLLGIFKKSQILFSSKINNTGDLYVDENSDKYVNDVNAESLVWKIFEDKKDELSGLSSNRYVYNRSFDYTGNILFKLDNDKTLVLNSSYIYDSYDFQVSKLSKLLFGKGTFKNILEDINEYTRKSSTFLNLIFENNNSNCYFKDNVRIKGNFRKARYDIHTKSNINQFLKSDGILFDNTLDLTLKIKKTLVSFFSNVYGSNTPLNGLYVNSQDSTYNDFVQEVRGHEWHSLEKSSFSWIASHNMQIGIRGEFESSHYSINSIFSQSSDKEKNTNSITRLKTIVTPTVSYKIRRWNMELNVPIVWFNAHVDANQQNRKYNKCRSSVWTKFIYKSPLNVTISLSTGLRFKFGPAEEFIANPIHLSYKDIAFLGNGRLSQRKSNFLTLSFDYHNIVNGIFASLSGNLFHTKKNNISSSYVTDTSIIKEVANGSSDIDNSSLTMNISKNFMNSCTYLSMSFKMNGVKQYRIIQNIRSRTLSNIYGIKLSVVQSLFDNKLTLNFTNDYVISFNNSLQTKDRYKSDKMDVTVSFSPFKFLEVYGNVTYYYLKSVNFDNNNVNMTSGVKYRKKGFEIGIDLHNITNQREYTIVRHLDEDAYYYSYNLRPREVKTYLRINF